MPIYTIVKQPQQIAWAAARQRVVRVTGYNIVNRDLAQQLWIGSDADGFGPPDFTALGRATSIIDPLGAVRVDAGLNWWAYAPGGGPVTVDTIPNSPSSTTSPALVAQQLQPKMLSTSLLRMAAPGSPYTVKTFPAASRIWFYHLSYSAETDNTFTGGLTNLYCELKTGSGLSLTVIERGVSATNQTVGGDSDASLVSGIPVAAGDTIILDINGAATLTGGNMRASCNILYSSP